MSKYDEICQAYRKSRREFLSYGETCRVFAHELIEGMIEYFEWPRNQEITFIQLGEEINPMDRFYALAGAMQMDDESFWHFGVEMTVHEPTGVYPQPFLMSFYIKKNGPIFIVKLGPKGEEIKIHEDRRRELGPFYEAVYVKIVSFFLKEYQEAINRKEMKPDFIMLANGQE
ncbi:MAG: hypothetical protein ACE5FD_05275 [Anaerolineae bacterium]